MRGKRRCALASDEGAKAVEADDSDAEASSLEIGNQFFALPEVAVTPRRVVFASDEDARRLVDVGGDALGAGGQGQSAELCAAFGGSPGEDDLLTLEGVDYGHCLPGACEDWSD
ncbi:hypothetical protein DLJ96_00405 [Actinotalea fermentans ATCC 43279 = JCM 9966 = DSM 3133]|nr:hypothetical protein DLJ96_00405 [Actinotalea fermentans ATCC 43279 = JCM 9966 = DSM 3133]